MTSAPATPDPGGKRPFGELCIQDDIKSQNHFTIEEKLTEGMAGNGCWRPRENQAKNKQYDRS